MNEWRTKPALHVKTVVEPPFSGETLAELIRAVLDKGKAFRFRARGVSMSPFIRGGDVVTVAPLIASSPKAGQIAAFIDAETGKVRVHRIVGVKAGKYLFRGDNALGADGGVPAESILGLVVRVERGGRSVRTGRGVAGAAIAQVSRIGLFIRILRRIGRAFRRPRREA